MGYESPEILQLATRGCREIPVKHGTDTRESWSPCPELGQRTTLKTKDADPDLRERHFPLSFLTKGFTMAMHYYDNWYMWLSFSNWGVTSIHCSPFLLSFYSKVCHKSSPSGITEGKQHDWTWQMFVVIYPLPSESTSFSIRSPPICFHLIYQVILLCNDAFWTQR